MSLTKDDVVDIINAHPKLFERLIDGKQVANADTGQLEWETDTSQLDKLTERAKRLLPLWRQWGLEELRALSFEDGRASEWGWS